jgi:DMSO/TMAO reductase YedYZ molybdopterin-dependent catalytic subunit
MHATPSDRLTESLSVEPIVRAASLAALDSESPPTEAHFRRDHFRPPLIDQDEWRVELRGSAGGALQLALGELRALPRHDLTVVLECAGHRRSEHVPAAAGIPWGVGAVSEARWTGTRLRSLLENVDTAGARFVLLEGADRGPFRGGSIVPFARALPIEKALHPDTLVAWEMNGEPLPEGHGAPLRAIVPGWYATDSIKWLTRVTVLSEPFQGPFEVEDYRLRTNREGGGTRLADLPVHSLLTSQRDRERMPAGVHLLRGIAWGGVGGARRVELSTNGSDWEEASLVLPSGPYAFARWSFRWHAEAGLRTIAVRAFDATGAAQGQEPTWNEGGYANSSIQRIRLLVG